MRLQLDYDSGDGPPGFPWGRLLAAVALIALIGLLAWLLAWGVIPRA